jgi:hypothetical protein
MFSTHKVAGSGSVSFNRWQDNERNSILQGPLADIVHTLDDKVPDQNTVPYTIVRNPGLGSRLDVAKCYNTKCINIHFEDLSV